MNHPHDWQHAFLTGFHHAQTAEPGILPRQLFCLEHGHEDGHLLLLGQNKQPMYLLLVSFGPIDHDGLWNFLGAVLDNFIRLEVRGGPPSEFPWCALGVLPAAATLPKADQEWIESRIEPLVGELAARLRSRHNHN